MRGRLHGEESQQPARVDQHRHRQAVCPSGREGSVQGERRSRALIGRGSSPARQNESAEGARGSRGSVAGRRIAQQRSPLTISTGQNVKPQAYIVRFTGTSAETAATWTVEAKERA